MSGNAGTVNACMQRARRAVKVKRGEVTFWTRKANRAMRHDTRRLMQRGAYDELPHRSRPAAWEIY